MEVKKEKRTHSEKDEKKKDKKEKKHTSEKKDKSHKHKDKKEKSKKHHDHKRESSSSDEVDVKSIKNVQPEPTTTSTNQPHDSFPQNILVDSIQFDTQTIPIDQLRRQLHIGSLSFDATVSMIFEMARQFGDIELLHVPQKNNGRLKGFAFIQYSQQASLDKAIQAFDSQPESFTICGRAVRFARRAEPAPVESTPLPQIRTKSNEAEPTYPTHDQPAAHTPRQYTPSTPTSSYASAADNTPCLFVGNLAFSVTKDDLMLFFDEYKPVRARIVYEAGTDNTRSKGFGYVDFPDGETATRVVQEKNKSNLFGRPLKLDVTKRRDKYNGMPIAGVPSDSSSQGTPNGRGRDGGSRGGFRGTPRGGRGSYGIPFGSNY
ncbi:hypothetical protein BLNAU_2149 [Blattamonas nauphoetae]|uniref:RRM domain-containing protein n=1 Tax=Blattamonas nauphoetae TaxID=2049346 RepID=A0ABQ9YG32_9EUKA|nr:hypothetical protein BLNAU_2149 [Blattamonas nauphoetae]